MDTSTLIPVEDTFMGLTTTQASYVAIAVIITAMLGLPTFVAWLAITTSRSASRMRREAAETIARIEEKERHQRIRQRHSVQTSH